MEKKRFLTRNQKIAIIVLTICFSIVVLLGYLFACFVGIIQTWDPIFSLRYHGGLPRPFDDFNISDRHFQFVARCYLSNMTVVIVTPPDREYGETVFMHWDIRLVSWRKVKFVPNPSMEQDSKHIEINDERLLSRLHPIVLNRKDNMLVVVNGYNGEMLYTHTMTGEQYREWFGNMGGESFDILKTIFHEIGIPETEAEEEYKRIHEAVEKTRRAIP